MLTDWRGTAITEGCTIVYPGRHSSSLWMNEGKVLRIEDRTSWGRDPYKVLVVQPTRTNGGRLYGPTPKHVTLTNVGNVTVVVP